MVRGKQTCKILKDIRRQIAEANDIEYITSECQYKGDCTGTCPKCEAEVQYLEQQLARKHMAGKAITILGVSAGLATMMPQPACAEPIHSEAPHGYYIVTPEIQEKPVIRVLPPDSLVQEVIPQDTTIYGTNQYDSPDTMPEFPGGMIELMKFISKKLDLKLPVYQGNGTQGRTTVRFVIEKDGSITNARILRGVDPYLDKEALRVVREFPKWKPGTVAGQPVRVEYTVPVMFRLQ